jgi:hypothetical protein
MDNSPPSILKSSLIGGAAFGLAGALPFIGALNCACCSLVMGGGFLAAYLYSNECKSLGVAFRAGGGAKLGVVAGIFYWLVSSITQGVIKIVFAGPSMEEIGEQVLDQMESGDAPPEAIDFVVQLFDTLSGPGGLAIVLAVSLVIALVFSTIGGLIGGAVFKVEPQPPATPDASAPPPPPVSP